MKKTSLRHPHEFRMPAPGMAGALPVLQPSKKKKCCKKYKKGKRCKKCPKR